MGLQGDDDDQDNRMDGAPLPIGKAREAKKSPGADTASTQARRKQLQGKRKNHPGRELL